MLYDYPVGRGTFTAEQNRPVRLWPAPLKHGKTGPANIDRKVHGSVSADVETIIVGAGVIGLAIARALSGMGHDVLVLERHDQIGAETSSRNSEVIHAGLYYQPGSLRATLCVRGKQMLYEFCKRNGVACKRSGKLLVAATEDEIRKLHAIRDLAAKNGVDDLRFLDRDAARTMEPNLECAAAYHSPSTGVIDAHGLMVALEGHIASTGGQVVLATTVTGITRADDGVYKITTTSGGETSSITCENLILSAGLHGSGLGQMIPYTQSYRPPRTYPAKGHYFTHTGPAPFSQPIYPMPVGAWLGVHLTLDVGGQTKFGPDISWLPGFDDGLSGDAAAALDYSFENEINRREAFAVQIRRYYPDLDAANLQPGYTGIRPKIYREGGEVADFAIHDAKHHGLDRLVALYGMESPGLTSCLAIGDYVAGRL